MLVTCDGLGFKFTEQMMDSELPSPNPRRSELSTILLTRIFFYLAFLTTLYANGAL